MRTVSINTDRDGSLLFLRETYANIMGGTETMPTEVEETLVEEALTE